MDIGTATPTLAERAGIPHHLMDIAEPTEPFTVAQYAALAEKTAREVHARGNLPILTGGTGFYLRALKHGLSLGGVKSDTALRETLKAQGATPEGRRAMHEHLQKIDPEAAARLHENDVQRVSRAVEVFTLTGKPISRQVPDEAECPFALCLIGTTMERARLYARINVRVDCMMSHGLLQEVETLLGNHVPATAQAMQGIGYKELVPVVMGGAPLDAAVATVRQNSRHYAKRQWTWFRAEPHFTWLDVESAGYVDEALRLGDTFWKEAKQWI
jgi:tRNA dimethylallyltransferase